ncbi:Cell division protein FtsX [Ruaniaceae bacterium KH17]|nr:Cell division protein FtsX [Ruaniaceae bacterium KH17]
MNRLFIGSARGARARLAGIAVGVMIGVALFLLLWGAAENLGARSERGTWAEWPQTSRYLENAADLRDDEAAIRPGVDYFEGTPIPTAAIAVTGATTVRAPGIATLPGPGEYVASPAAAELIDAQPRELLAERYGTRIGEIGRAGLESPDQLLIIIGASAEELTRFASAILVTEFAGYDYVSDAYRGLAVVGAIAVLIPVLLLIGIVTDLGAAQRAERIATLRLIGATPRKVARLTAVETAVTTAAGAIFGIGLYFALIPLAAQIRVNSGRFFIEDLVASPAGIALAVLIAVGLSTLVAWWRALRGDLGPLGASRERHERAPRAISLIPLGVGIAALVTFAAGVFPTNLNYVLMIVMVAAFLLIGGGLLVAGPYLTHLAARRVGRRSQGLAVMMATGRISRHPRATFRAVSGLIVAVFTATVFSVAITSVSGIPDVAEDPDLLPADVLVAEAAPGQSDAESVAESIAALPGVTGVASASNSPDGDRVIHADELRVIAPDADVPAGAEWLNLEWDWRITAAEGGQVPGSYAVILVATDGSPEAIERARTALLTSDLDLHATPQTRADAAAAATLANDNQFAVLAYLGILVATAISAVALAVSSLASVFERQRVFGLMRLTGMSTRRLRAVISLEALLPVAAVFAGSIGFGVLTAWALVVGASDGRRAIGWPEPAYYLILGVCAVLMVGAIGGTFRAAVRATGGDATRFE